MALNIPKYDVISDVSTGCAEISSGPKSPPPIALADFRELHLDLVERTPFGALHEIADGNVGRHRDKHVDVIARQHALDDLHTHFTADLPDNVCVGSGASPPAVGFDRRYKVLQGKLRERVRDIITNWELPLAHTKLSLLA